MADYLSNDGELLTEEPPKWSDVEASPKYKDLSNVDRRVAFSKWDNYSRRYAKQEGLWDDPEFQSKYQEKADSVAKGFRTWTDTYQQGAINSYNLVRNTGRAAYRGWLEGEVATELQKPVADPNKIADLQTKISAYAPTEDVTKAWDPSVPDAESFEAFKKDPVGNIAQMLAGSLGAQTRAQLSTLYKIPERAVQGLVGGAVGGSAVGGIPGGVAGGVGGLRVGIGTGFAESTMLASYATQYAETFVGELQKAGVDVTNRDQLESALSDPDKISKIRKKADKAGVPVGVWDGISALIGGNVFSNPAKKLVGKAGQWAGEIGVQSLLGMTGETHKQLLMEGKITDKKAILAEGIMEPASGAVEVAVGRLNKVVKDAKPDQVAKIAETKTTVDGLQQTGSPLAAQALAKSTADALVTDDPGLVSDLIDEQAPEGTFVPEAAGDEKFAPPADRTPEEALAAVPPTLQPEIAPEAQATAVVNGKAFTGSTHGEAYLKASQELGKEAAKTAELGWIDNQGKFTSNRAGETEGQLSAAVRDGLPDDEIRAIEAKLMQRQAIDSEISAKLTPNEKPTQAAVPTTNVNVLAVESQPPTAVQPVAVRSVEQPAASAPAGVSEIPVSEPTQPNVSGPAISATTVASQPVEVGANVQPVAAPAVKPSSQSTASFTPEQNASHQTFIDTQPSPEVPEEAKTFSSWAQKNVPKNRPIILYNDKGQTAVITPSSKPDRQNQVTFMDVGNEGGSEAFHDIAAQSVDEGIAEAYRRGYTNTQNYKSYERASENTTAGEGSASPNLESRVGRPSGELPGAPEVVRAEVPAPGTATGTEAGRPVTIQVWDKKSKAVVSMDTTADAKLLRDLKVHDGIYKALIRCL